MIFQTRVGAHTVFAIEDGWFYRDPTEFFVGSDPGYWQAEHYDAGRLRVSAGCFLIAGPEGLIMVDSGLGAGTEPYSEGGAAGKLPESLTTLHVDPSDISAVLHTHMHPDHIGGNLTAEREIFFSEAQFYVHSKEFSYWTTGEQAGSVAQEKMQPVVDADRLELVDKDHEVLPGITMLESFGHTPGHMSVHLASEGTRAFVTGDTLHHPAQVEHPEWTVPADVDRSQAVKTRKRLLDELTDSGTLVAAGHCPRPGLGQIVLDERVRVFMPAPATEIS